MPYNNTPITPSKEVTGHVSLPLARVQKIIQADPERLTVSKNAAFAIALATEMFIQHIATTTHNVVKAERKPRRNIQYRDVSSAVAKTDNLEFLVDVVPRTTTYGQFKRGLEGKKAVETVSGHVQRVEQQEAEEDIAGPSNSQPRAGEKEKPQSEPLVDAAKPDEVAEAMEVDQKPEAELERVEDSELEVDAAAMQIEMEMRGPPRSILSASASPTVQRVSGGFTAINGSR